MGHSHSKGTVKSSSQVAIGPSAAAPVAASYLGVSFKTNDPDVIAIFNSINSALDNYRKTGFCPKVGRVWIVSFNQALDTYAATAKCTENIVLNSGNVPNNYKFLVAASGAQPGGLLVDCTSGGASLKCDDVKVVFAQAAAKIISNSDAMFSTQVIAAFNTIIDRCCVGGKINHAKAKRLAAAIISAVCWEMSDSLMAPAE